MAYTHIMGQIADTMTRYLLKIRPLRSSFSKYAMRRLVKAMSGVTDARMAGKCVYETGELLGMVFYAKLVGCDTCGQISNFWKCNPSRYRAIFGRDTVPHRDTMARAMDKFDPGSLEEVTVKLQKDCARRLRRRFGMPYPKYRHFPSDGQAKRGSGRNRSADGKLRDYQIMHLFDSDDGIVWYSSLIDKKSNEIPSFREQLRKMDVPEGALFTFDAMNSNEETIRTIREVGGDYIGGLKGSQGKSLDAAIALFGGGRLEELERSPETYLRTEDIAHSAVEVREFYVLRLTKAMIRANNLEKWEGLKSLVMVRKTSTPKPQLVRKDKGRKAAGGQPDTNVADKAEAEEKPAEPTVEVRFYIASIKNINDIAYGIRGQWAVECLHNDDDNVMMEDASRCTHGTMVMVMSLMNTLVIYLLSLVQAICKEMSNADLSKSNIRKSMLFENTLYLTLALILADPDLSINRYITLEKINR